MTKDLRTKAVPDSELVDQLMIVNPRLMHKMGRFFDRHLKTASIVLPHQFRALMTVAQYEKPIAMNHLAEALGLSAGTVTASAKTLITNGLISRQRSPTDDRVVLISLTPAGRELIRKHEELVRQVFTDILSRLSWQKQRQFVEAQMKLDSLLQEIK